MRRNYPALSADAVSSKQLKQHCRDSVRLMDIERNSLEKWWMSQKIFLRKTSWDFLWYMRIDNPFHLRKISTRWIFFSSSTNQEKLQQTRQEKIVVFFQHTDQQISEEARTKEFSEWVENKRILHGDRKEVKTTCKSKWQLSCKPSATHHTQPFPRKTRWKLARFWKITQKFKQCGKHCSSKPTTLLSTSFTRPSITILQNSTTSNKK